MEIPIRISMTVGKNVLCVPGVTGPVVMDYKGDRIMDYQVWYLASDSDKFDGLMKIPLMKAASNATACVEWLVKQFTLIMFACVWFAACVFCINK